MKHWYKSNQQYAEVDDICKGDGWDYYVWGQVVNVHRVGEYAIIEYVNVENTSPDFGKHFFHPAIWTDRFAETSYLSLDETLVGVIAYKHDGDNSHAAYYFFKMVGIQN